ncbi:MAG: isochorismatase family protein [Bacteroidales bacterium]|nr:isochorismatase family protein [Bacteroidales bacterium]
MKKVLIIVDCQYDFVNPNGSLFVEGSEDLPERIAGIMERFDDIIFTLDWHPYNHCSFIYNGGDWPTHCVNYTKGASIKGVLFIESYGKPTLFFRKGENPYREEYGAFSEFNKHNKTEFLQFINNIQHTYGDDSVDLYVCGVAGDYCVKETTKDLCKLEYTLVNDIFIIKDLCPCIDTAFDIEAFAKEVGAKCVESKDV